MTDFPGTQPSFVQLIDDPGGDPYQANQVNVLYNEVEAIAAHLGAGTPICAGGGIRLTLKDGLHTVGYAGQKAVYALADTPVTIVPGGSGDITSGAVIAGWVKPSSGMAMGGISICASGETITIYDDGEGNQVTFQINAGGDVVVARAAGSKTYQIVINLLCWI